METNVSLHFVMIQGIRHIIFDLGGVLLNIDYQLTEQAFKNLGIAAFDAIYSQLKQTPLFDELETGKITALDFYDTLRHLSGLDIPNDRLEKAWNAMLLDFPLRRLQLLQQLRLYHDLFLLSNTNEIHEAAFSQTLFSQHALPAGLGVFFDRVYFSHQIGLRKPNREVFELVLQENQLQPNHTLFIDDSPQHIETAKKLGIQTIWLEKGMTIEEHVFLPRP
jgi:putative hydrolase of the HAD superfamily